MNQAVDYYKVLQVSRGAGRDDITAAYRRLVKLYHPDVDSSPSAGELMKQINLAYSALIKSPAQETDMDGGVRTSGTQAAKSCVEGYFAALLAGDFAAAYGFVSDHDKKYVTYQSFCEWRKSVQRLFVMREFSVNAAGRIFAHSLGDASEAPAAKHNVMITEKNTVSQAVERYTITKLSIAEPGGWRVFLGYRDLSEIAKLFEDFSARQEHGEMARHWEEYCRNTCRDLNMYNLNGFLQRAEPELYRYSRYRQQMTVACFRVRPVSASAPGLSAEAVETAAKAIGDSLRETDIPAYLGGGVFAVLFVELRRRHAEMITQRIVNRLKGIMHKNLRMSIYAECAYLPFEGGELREYVEKCSNLEG